jgi:hypothetical protein
VDISTQRGVEISTIHVCDGLTRSTGLGGVFERLITLTDAAGIAVLASGVTRRSRTASY